MGTINFESIATVLGSAMAVYLISMSLVVFAGKRSGAKLNNFDWLVTIAIGALMGTTTLSTQVTILEGAVAILCMISLQWCFTKLCIISPTFNDLVHKRPSVLVVNGRLRMQELIKHRITPGEVRSAIRLKGYSHECDVALVVLEPCGSISVIYRCNDIEKILNELHSKA